KGIDIVVNAQDGSSMVHADIGLMQRVLENLLRNAVRYTPQGGAISISLDRKPGCVAVAVADTGCGIAEHELDRIFDRFYRSEQGEEERTNSAGLGLAIVKRILDLHGSRITVDSIVNQGTRFEFDVPARAA
ncbi:MAG: ATP-binding protein, partial [Xanthomonadales bacterium]|nr:ATP-binding protein [Xanthomonadales bacterium]